MATTVDISQLDGLFKEVYADRIENLIPESAKLINDVKFVEAQKIGDSYHQPVILSGEQGVTYAGPTAGAFTLNTSIAMTMKDASVQGYQMLLRSQISYDAASRAVKEGAKSFKNGTGLLVMNMSESLNKRLEVSMWYGQTGFAQVNASANVDSTHTVMTVQTGHFASGIFSGLEGAKFDAYDSTTKKNTNAVLVIDSVDLDNKTITVSGNSTDIAALDTFLASGTCQLHFETAYGNEMPGVDKIITNTGTLFGISAATYGLWKGNTHSAGSGALTLVKVLSAVSKAVQRGLDENVKLYVNPTTWANLNSDEAALRRYNSGDREAMRAHESIVYHSQNGLIEVVPHNIIKEGEAFIMSPNRWKRVGSTDVTFNNPGKGGEFFRELTDAAGFELRAYLDQAIFTECPARSVKITNIVNS